jgi:polysaccharide biosynthesis/export protein
MTTSRLRVPPRPPARGGRATACGDFDTDQASDRASRTGIRRTFFPTRTATVERMRQSCDPSAGPSTRPSARHPTPSARHRTRRWGATLATLVTLLALGVGSPPPAAAQVPTEWDAAREQANRQELEDLLVQLEDQARSSAYSQRMRDHARQSADLVRARLQEGDFQVGDRIVLEVEGEPELSDTLTVRSGRVVNIPVVGSMSVAGILRSELQEHISEHLSQYVRNPTVRTEALIRVTVQGEVGQPGFYVLPADYLITDALTLAGGPTGSAKLTDLRIERGSTRIWEGEALELAIVQGRTLDQLNIQAGDRIVVPVDRQRDGWEMFRIVAMTAGSLVSLGYALTRIF